MDTITNRCGRIRFLKLMIFGAPNWPARLKSQFLRLTNMFTSSFSMSLSFLLRLRDLDLFFSCLWVIDLLEICSRRRLSAMFIWTFRQIRRNVFVSEINVKNCVLLRWNNLNSIFHLKLNKTFVGNQREKLHSFK